MHGDESEIGRDATEVADPAAIEVAPEAPWAMQLVARVEKVGPPQVADLCAAAALATIGVVEQAAADGDSAHWQVAIDAWTVTGRIRKLVRRARGAAWERAQSAPGVTAAVGTGQVRAYVPSPMDAVPEVVAGLQIRSSPLEEPDGHDLFVEPAVLTLVVALTPAVSMTWGKRCAQTAHAAQLLWTRAATPEREAWIADGRAIQVLLPDANDWDTLVERAGVEVRDGGFTEVEPGTFTALAFWAESGD